MGLRVFLSWSGEVSSECARHTKVWLENVLGAVDIVLSHDFPAGVGWSDHVIAAARDCDVCVLCIVGNNQDAPWMNFEAGLIAGTGAVMPLVFSDEGWRAYSGPLKRYQATSLSMSNLRRFVFQLNGLQPENAGRDPDVLDRAFRDFWPTFEEKIADVVVKPRDRTRNRDRRLARVELEGLQVQRLIGAARGIISYLEDEGGSRQRALMGLRRIIETLRQSGAAPIATEQLMSQVDRVLSQVSTSGDTDGLDN